ncbi:hypothetical protein JMM59_14995 [Rhodovulum sulfidophilum]|uniref:hypothetical protein n=1 Tax=Rhodovulum sulfidophilum TaxID=35806 RepID=UPI001921C7C9|nr:hypothetical protein [Rhodovulum sulfidophilum]MBL3566298.1 hypothetical protein [Rhodovulum sulfidophilum]
MAGEDAADLFDLGAVRPDEEFTQCYSGECRVNLLPTLYRLNHAISNATDLSAPLGMILEVRGAARLADARARSAAIR